MLKPRTTTNAPTPDKPGGNPPGTFYQEAGSGGGALAEGRDAGYAGAGAAY